MKKRIEYIYEDIGELYLRQRKIAKNITDIETMVQESDTPSKTTFLLGKLSALTDHRKTKHKKIIEELINTKKVLENNQYYDSILDEVEYVEGYIEGLTFLLNVDKELFNISPNFVLFIYATNDSLMQKYDLALSLHEKMGAYDTDKPVRYYCSLAVDDICEKIANLDEETMNAVCVVYQGNSLPSKEMLQQLAFEKNDNVFIVCDRDEIAV